MKRILTLAAIVAMMIGCIGTQQETTPAAEDTAPGFTLSDEMTEVKVGEDGSLLVLRNRETGHNYAAGAGMWRLFYNTHEEKEMQSGNHVVFLPRYGDEDEDDDEFDLRLGSNGCDDDE